MFVMEASMRELVQDGWKFEWMFEQKIVGVSRSGGRGRQKRSKVVTKYRRVRRRVPNMTWIDGTG